MSDDGIGTELGILQDAGINRLGMFCLIIYLYSLNFPVPLSFITLLKNELL